jgi:hypothetical protein
MEDNDYHVRKRQLYLDAGYRPFFFREDEICTKPNIVLGIIKNALGLSRKVYARKCQIVKLESTEFFHKHHLMGIGQGYGLGLEYQNELVCAVQIRRKKDKVFEISRFCSAPGISVVGGFSKLLAAVVKTSQPDNIITFIDLRYGMGDYLEGLGFEKHKTYPSFKWTDHIKTYHRLQYPGNTGYEKGMRKIWDCGQTKFVKNYNSEVMEWSG